MQLLNNQNDIDLLRYCSMHYLHSVSLPVNAAAWLRRVQIWNIYSVVFGICREIILCILSMILIKVRNNLALPSLKCTLSSLNLLCLLYTVTNRQLAQVCFSFFSLIKISKIYTLSKTSAIESYFMMIHDQKVLGIIVSMNLVLFFFSFIFKLSAKHDFGNFSLCQQKRLKGFSKKPFQD